MNPSVITDYLSLHQPEWNSDEEGHPSIYYGTEMSAMHPMIIPEMTTMYLTIALNSLAPGRYDNDLNIMIIEPILWIDILQFLRNYPQVNATEYYWYVNLGSGNGSICLGLRCWSLIHLMVIFILNR